MVPFFLQPCPFCYRLHFVSVIRSELVFEARAAPPIAAEATQQRIHPVVVVAEASSSASPTDFIHLFYCIFCSVCASISTLNPGTVTWSHPGAPWGPNQTAGPSASLVPSCSSLAQTDQAWPRHTLSLPDLVDWDV